MLSVVIGGAIGAVGGAFGRVVSLSKGLGRLFGSVMLIFTSMRMVYAGAASWDLGKPMLLMDGLQTHLGSPRKSAGIPTWTFAGTWPAAASGPPRSEVAGSL